MEMYGDFSDKEEQIVVNKEVQVSDKTKQDVLTRLNNLNHPFTIQNSDKSFVIPLNNFDNILISMQLDKIYDDPKAPKKIYSGFLNVEIDLQTFNVYFFNKEDIKGFENDYFKLIREEKGTRRQRGRDSEKYKDGDFKQTDSSFAKEVGEFQYKYREKVIGSNHKMPSIRQVMQGLYLHYVEWGNTKMTNMTHKAK